MSLQVGRHISCFSNAVLKQAEKYKSSDDVGKLSLELYTTSITDIFGALMSFLGIANSFVVASTGG